MKYFNIILFYSLLSVSLPSILVSNDKAQKHSLLDNSQIITSISPRSDELLRETIELGRILANPNNINFGSWVEFFGRDILMVATLSSGGIYCNTHYSFIKQFLLTVATTTSVTIGLTTSLSYIMVKYKRWQFNRHIAYLKQLITQSTNQADLLIAHELMCRYLAEVSLLSLNHEKNTAVKQCYDLLRDIVNLLHHRISELKKEESRLIQQE
jgi:hypothetical protein